MDERLPREHELDNVSGTGTGELRRSFSWRLRILACVALACVAAACAVRLGLTVPTWVSWQNRTLSCDLDADGFPEELTLAGQRVLVRDADGRLLYESDGAWRVSDALVTDVTRDGRPELVMLLWRRGNYGNSRPFWESGIDPRMTQHVYVMGLEGDAMQPVWMGHELGEGLKVSQMKATEDGLLELTTTDGQTSTWEWDYFGFSLVE